MTENNVNKILLWPDTHFPKHDQRKVTILLDVVKQWVPDTLVFLGDLDDMEAPGRFAEGKPEEWSQRVDVTTNAYTKQFLEEIRDMLPDADIHYFEGNHEVRLTEYVAKNAPALDGHVSLPKILDLDNLGITWHQYKEPPVKMFGSSRHGYWYCHHGSYVSKYTGDSARKEVESYGVSGFSAHTHRLGNFKHRYMDRDVFWYECGHLSDPVQQDYNQWHNWYPGFVYAFEDGGRVYPFEAPFKGNTVYVDGKKFS